MSLNQLFANSFRTRNNMNLFGNHYDKYYLWVFIRIVRLISRDRNGQIIFT